MNYSETEKNMTHITHGGTFEVKEENGEFLFSFTYTGKETPDFVTYGDSALRGGRITLPDGAKEKAAEPATFTQNGEYGAASLVYPDGIQTVFFFDGGICVLGCGLGGCEAQVNHCFADPDVKMKVFEHSVTMGGFIYRSLIDEAPFRKNVRPTPPLSGEGEKRDLFTIFLPIPEEYPCFAYEVTRIGMAHACEVMADNPSCMAIMLDGGAILSYSPETKTLTVM